MRYCDRLTISHFHFYFLPYLDHRQMSKVMLSCIHYYLWPFLSNLLAPVFYRKLPTKKIQTPGETKDNIINKNALRQSTLKSMIRTQVAKGKKKSLCKILKIKFLPVFNGAFVFSMVAHLQMNNSWKRSIRLLG